MLSNQNCFFSYRTSYKKYRNATSILKYLRQFNLISSALLALFIKDSQLNLANIFKRLAIKRRSKKNKNQSKLSFSKMKRPRKIKQNRMSNNKIKLNQSLQSQKLINSQIQKSKLSKYTRDTVRTGMISLRYLYVTGHSCLFMADWI
jgi:hypothetical protein